MGARVTNKILGTSSVFETVYKALIYLQDALEYDSSNGVRFEIEVVHIPRIGGGH